MTESEFVALALSKYEQIKSLENSADFYQHEKDFDQVWTELGGQVLEKTLGEQPASARKKKRPDPLRQGEPAQRTPLPAEPLHAAESVPAGVVRVLRAVHLLRLG